MRMIFSLSCLKILFAQIDLKLEVTQYFGFIGKMYTMKKIRKFQFTTYKSVPKLLSEMSVFEKSGSPEGLMKFDRVSLGKSAGD